MKRSAKRFLPALGRLIPVLVFLLAVAVSNRAGTLTLFKRVRSGNNWRHRVANRERLEWPFCQAGEFVVVHEQSTPTVGRTVDGVCQFVLSVSDDGESSHGSQANGPDEGTHYDECRRVVGG